MTIDLRRYYPGWIVVAERNGFEPRAPPTPWPLTIKKLPEVEDTALSIPMRYHRLSHFSCRANKAKIFHVRFEI
jgi:hypothetical protein